MYTKLYDLGEVSIIRKSNEARKEEYNFERQKKIEEEEKKITEEKGIRSSSGGLFFTEVKI